MMSEHEKLGDLIIEGLEEAAAYRRGERPDLRVVRYVRREDGTVERIDSRERESRAGWDESFRRMAAQGDDRLLNDTPSTTRWDQEEWEWPEDS
jgi:hypothetical protein